MKFIKLTSILLAAALLTSCAANNTPAVVPSSTQVTSNTSTPAVTTAGQAEPTVSTVQLTELPSGVKTIPTPIDISGLLPLTREAAGLSTIEKLDFSKFKLNSRIAGLLGAEKYSDGDYKGGLASTDEGILVTERFKDPIIEDIRIGASFSDVKKALGKPSFIMKDTAFYKTRKYYIGFKGIDKIELAVIRNNPADYDRSIMKKILSVLADSGDQELIDTVDSNPEAAGFFEASGHINGGGWYANSDNGIKLVQFDVDTATVYNNFEGDLFNYISGSTRYKVCFEDKDYIGKQMFYTLQDYKSTNETFIAEGALSPSGRLKAIYEWIYSMSQYFTIRTMDNSRPDYRIPAMSKEYRWLDDGHILYLHTFSSLPYILGVDEKNSKSINVFAVLGLMKDDADESFEDYDFEIADIKDNTILLNDKKSGKSYRIKYGVTQDGKIMLSE